VFSSFLLLEAYCPFGVLILLVHHISDSSYLFLFAI
jgi:hypothetical protein